MFRACIRAHGSCAGTGREPIGKKLNKRQTGTEKEELACRYLEERGMQILERNFCTRYGEIDVIGLHEGYLVFVEVKYRASLRCGFPEEAVTGAKRRIICRVAERYMYTHAPVVSQADFGARYDVVAILGGQVRWIQNAFEHCGERYGYFYGF